MAKNFVIGLIATVLAVAVYLFTNWLGIGDPNQGVGTVLGLLAGLVVGLAPDRSPLGRYLAFLVGLIVGILALVLGAIGWIGWVILSLIFTVISFLTGGRLPIWPMFLGAGALAAIYSPWILQAWFIATDYPTALFVSLAASAGGFMVVVAVELFGDDTTDDEVDNRQLQTSTIGDAK